MKKKMLKKFADLNEFLKSRDEKLSDKYHELELSHNRKCNFLRKIHKELLAAKNDEHTFYNKDGEAMILIRLDPLIRDVEFELFCHGRERLCSNVRK